MMLKKRGDYLSSLKRARRKRNNTYTKVIIIAAIAAVIIAGIVFATMMKGKKKSGLDVSSLATPSKPAVATEAPKEPEDPTVVTDLYINAVLDKYDNIGMVKVNGYLWMRSEPGKDGDRLAKLYNNYAVDILEEVQDEEGKTWYKVLSNDMEGYAYAESIITGDEAVELARSEVKYRAIVNADKVNIRKEPNLEADSWDLAYTTYSYPVVAEHEEWVEVTVEDNVGFIAKDLVTLNYAIREARKLDERTKVLNENKKLVISNTTDYLNIRSSPKLEGDENIIGKLTSHAAGTIIDEEGIPDGWLKIKSGSITGYVSSEHVLTGSPAADVAINEAQLMMVVNGDALGGGSLNVREAPNTNEGTKIYTSIISGEKYSVVGYSTDDAGGSWVEIELEDDNNGFVSADYVNVKYALNEAIKFSPAEDARNAALARRNQIVNYAMQFLGNRYVWGGTSLTNGCDCSGFTMKVLGNYGVGLPHYSVSQSKMGKPVDSANMRPGDLIFYRNRRGVINHVSMYIGNGQVIHAASRRSGIKISTWNYRSPAAIRNVLGD